MMNEIDSSEELHEECGGQRRGIHHLLWTVCVAAPRTGELRYCGEPDRWTEEKFML